VHCLRETPSTVDADLAICFLYTNSSNFEGRKSLTGNMTECCPAWGWFAVVAVPSVAFLLFMTLNHMDGTPVAYYPFKTIAVTSLVLTSARCASYQSMFFFQWRVLLKLFVVQVLIWLALGSVLHSVFV
jgi:hypothetical protein